MAASSGNGSQRNVMTGELPADFLRIDSQPPMQGGAPNPAYTQQVYYQTPPVFQPANQLTGRLSITITQAKLAKNYGLTRMDPYCRIRIGNMVFETPTAHNGAIHPRWNKLISCPVSADMTSVYVEIFDECAFSMDERIAWGLVPVKDIVYQGETVDDWYSLSGKQGEDKEGMINLVFTYRDQPVQNIAYQQPAMMMVSAPPPVIIPAPFPGVPGQIVPPRQQQQPPASTCSPQDFQTVKDMFPNMDDDVIRSVLHSSRGNVDTAINHLLSMSSD